MKPLEWVLAIGLMAGGAVLAAFIAILACLPYIVIGLAGFALLRYLGWF